MQTPPLFCRASLEAECKATDRRGNMQAKTIGTIFVLLLALTALFAILYVTDPASPGHQGARHKTHAQIQTAVEASNGAKAPVEMGSRVYIGNSETSMGHISGDRYIASGCDRDNDGNDVAVKVVLFGGKVLKKRDTNGPGDNGCAVIDIHVAKEPAYHQLLEYKNHSDTVLRRSTVSCHNPASREC